MSLARRYAGQYIAIVDGAVVDHDVAFDALARRVFARHGWRDIYMPRVAATEPPAAHVRSPRLARR